MGLSTQEAMRRLMKRAKKGTISAVVSAPGGGTVTGNVADPSALVRPGRSPALGQTMGALGGAVTAGAQRMAAQEQPSPVGTAPQGQVLKPLSEQPEHLQYLAGRAKQYESPTDPKGASPEGAGAISPEAKLHQRAYGDVQYDAPDIRTQADIKKQADLDEAKKLQPSATALAVRKRISDRAAGKKPDAGGGKVGLIGTLNAMSAKVNADRYAAEADRKTADEQRKRKEHMEDWLAKQEHLRKHGSAEYKMLIPMDEAHTAADRSIMGWLYKDDTVANEGYIGEAMVDAGGADKWNELSDAKQTELRQANMKARLSDLISQLREYRYPNTVIRRIVRGAVKRHSHDANVRADFKVVESQLDFTSKLDAAGAKPKVGDTPPKKPAEGQEYVTGDASGELPPDLPPPSQFGGYPDEDEAPAPPKKPEVPETPEEAEQADDVAGRVADLKEYLEGRFMSADEAEATLNDQIAELVDLGQDEAAEAFGVEGLKMIEKLRIDPEVEAVLMQHGEELREDPDLAIGLAETIEFASPDQRMQFLREAQKMQAVELRDKAAKDPKKLAEEDYSELTGTKMPKEGKPISKEQIIALAEYFKRQHGGDLVRAEEMVRLVIAANEWDTGAK